MKIGLVLSLAILAISSVAGADEGMWLLNRFPTKKVEKKYRFNATDAWLKHVQVSAARLAGGCSASFVSSNGLVMTNHHCAHSCIEQLSTSSRDFVTTGFYAKDQEKEVKCPEMEVNRLVDIKDVTAELQKATKGLQGPAFNEANKAAMSKLEKECTGGSESIRCDVVTLYHGGEYHLYKYQRFQDVRLVFAPEFAIAFFGGDPDNFMFPRYDLDVSFLRVYENGKPLETQDYFKWSTESAKDGDMAFVTGHPGSTSRLLTIAQLEYARDHQLYDSLLYLSELRGMLAEFQNRGAEQKRIANSDLFGVENGYKALKGRMLALKDKDLFAAKVKAENALRKKVNANAKWKKEYGPAWDQIAKAETELIKFRKRLNKIENQTYGSKLFEIARTLVRAADELPKPNEKRFREFNDANLPRIKQDLFSEAPIYDELEIALMEFNMKNSREELTSDDPFIKKLLGKKSPKELATELVKGSRLRDVKVRKALFDGGKKAIEESKDPMIQLALRTDPDAREIRKKFEDEIEPVIKQNSEKIAKAHFAVYGPANYPDATFTLRISYGQIKGYEENGRKIEPVTVMQGAFDRHTGSDPYALPESWLKAKSDLNMQTPMNFASTNDIIGGNSGSPVINQKGEVIGLIFDGNIQSLGGAYVFDESVNRSVSVHSAAIIEALKKVYGADRIVRDLLGQ